MMRDEGQPKGYHHHHPLVDVCLLRDGGGVKCTPSHRMLHLIGPVRRSDILARGLDAGGAAVGFLRTSESHVSTVRVGQLEGLHLTREGRLEVDLEATLIGEELE